LRRLHSLMFPLRSANCIVDLRHGRSHHHRAYTFLCHLEKSCGGSTPPTPGRPLEASRPRSPLRPPDPPGSHARCGIAIASRWGRPSAW
jgi:hypothetical protein